MLKSSTSASRVRSCVPEVRRPRRRKGAQVVRSVHKGSTCQNISLLIETSSNTKLISLRLGFLIDTCRWPCTDLFAHVYTFVRNAEVLHHEDKSLPVVLPDQEQKIVFRLGSSPFQILDKPFGVLAGAKLVIEASLPEVPHEVELVKEGVEVLEVPVHQLAVEAELHNVEVGHLHEEVIVAQLEVTDRCGLLEGTLQ